MTISYNLARTTNSERCIAVQLDFFAQRVRTSSQHHCACCSVCCIALQGVAVCCSVLQCVAVCCSVLQCVAVCCSVLQCVAVCCSVLQMIRNAFRSSLIPSRSEYVPPPNITVRVVLRAAVCAAVCVAVCCVAVLQRIVVCTRSERCIAVQLDFFAQRVRASCQLHCVCCTVCCSVCCSVLQCVVFQCCNVLHWAHIVSALWSSLISSCSE